MLVHNVYRWFYQTVDIGMSDIIELVRDSSAMGGRDRYSLSSDAWLLLLEIGATFGWKPSGTTYLRQPAKKPSTERSTADAKLNAVHDYLPGSCRDYKRVEAEDADAWARALDAARQSPYFTTMLGERPGIVVLSDGVSAEETRSVSAPFAITMAEFIQYAYGGAFAFAQAP